MRPPPFIETLNALGYEAHLHDEAADVKDDTLARLIRALGGRRLRRQQHHAAVGLGLVGRRRRRRATCSTGSRRLIALPALAYSGRIFFRSAWQRLRHGRTNMDVPISIGVLLAFGMSLYETVHHGPHAYFDAAISLLFFLLIGRTLDHMMRERARVAVRGLARLAARGALVLQPDGSSELSAGRRDLQPGMTILLAAGERVPVDARVVTGRSELDCSLVSGESLPQPVPVRQPRCRPERSTSPAPLTIVATAAAKDSFLAEMVRMMEAAEVRPLRLPPHRRPRRAALCARGPSHGAADIHRLDDRHRRRRIAPSRSRSRS